MGDCCFCLPDRGGDQSQNPGPGRDLGPRGRLTPDQGPGPGPLSRIENPAPGLTPNPSPRLNLYPSKYRPRGSSAFLWRWSLPCQFICNLVPSCNLHEAFIV